MWIILISNHFAAEDHSDGQPPPPHRPSDRASPDGSLRFGRSPPPRGRQAHPDGHPRPSRSGRPGRRPQPGAVARRGPPGQPHRKDLPMSLEPRPRVAILGTGKMGSAIASRLAGAGFELTLWNRTRERAVALGIGQVAETPAAAARDAEVVISSLTGPEAVRA